MPDPNQYDFDEGHWERAGGGRWNFQGEEWYCHDYIDPYRCFELRVDTCQGFNPETSEYDTMHAVVMSPYTRDANGDIVSDYACYSEEFTTSGEAHRKAYDVMRAVDAGDYDNEIVDNLAKGRASQDASARVQP